MREPDRAVGDHGRREAARAAAVTGPGERLGGGVGLAEPGVPVAGARALLGLGQPRKAADAAPSGPTGLAEEEKLLADLGEILTAERVRISELPFLLRSHDPEWMPYRRLTGRNIAQLLRARGIRMTNTGNVMRLDPADLRRVAVEEAG